VSFSKHVPPAPLRPFVAAAQGYGVPTNPSGVHRGLPSRHLTLVIELTAPLRVALGGLVSAHGVVGGLHTSAALLDASRPQEGLQYDLTVRSARALLGVPAVELSGVAVDLADLLGPQAATVLEQLHAADDQRERFRLLDAALLRRLRARSEPVGMPREVAEAWRLIFASDGRARVVSAVATQVGWSRRHLSGQFRLATGLTPKQAARIARFEAARRLLVVPARSPLAAVAARCGYADQAHLAREWQALAGCRLSTWLREELPFVQDSATGPEEESSA
jgi:AraC-like DNA-binding protein